MKKYIISALLLIGFLASQAPAVMFNGNYDQNFNSMGTGTAAPAGWSVYSISGSHDQFKPADDPTGTGALPTGNDIKIGTLQTTLKAETPNTTTSQKSSQGYNWAIDGSSTERSLGTSPTGIAGMVLQLQLTNNSVATNQISIDYDVRVLGTTTNNNNYTTNNYVGIEELPGYRLFYSLDNGATYTNIASLNADGHTWANALGTVHESVANYTLSGTWSIGSTLNLRWFDDNAQGPSPDQRLGLDNIVINSVPEPATITLLSLGLSSLVLRRNKK
jgi:predicted RNA binding protein YcfA (HicA-like mRNA interferase family)